MFNKVVIVQLGKFKSCEYEALFNEYVSRLKRYVNLELKLIKITSDEKEYFEKVMPKIKEATAKTKLIVLSERGKNINSHSLADFINSGTGTLSILVGTSWGLPKELEEKADLLLSFGSLTLPHEAVRFLIAEQLYRVFTIIKGENYHK